MLLTISTTHSPATDSWSGDCCAEYTNASSPCSPWNPSRWIRGCGAPVDGGDHDVAVALIESWLRFRVVETTVQLVLDALSAARRWRISYWDATVLEAARSGGCSTLLTEDLQAGMNFAGVTVENPFSVSA